MISLWTALWTFLSLKNDVNVKKYPNRQKKKLDKFIFLVAILKVTDENGRIRIRIRLVRGADPYQNVTDPQHWKKGKGLDRIANRSGSLPCGRPCSAGADPPPCQRRRRNPDSGRRTCWRPACGRSCAHPSRGVAHCACWNRYIYIVKSGDAIQIAADELVGAQRPVEAVHILLVPLRTVLAATNIIYIGKNSYHQRRKSQRIEIHRLAYRFSIDF